MADDVIRQGEVQERPQEQLEEQTAIKEPAEDIGATDVIEEIDSELEELEDEQIEWTEDMMPKFETPVLNNQAQATQGAGDQVQTQGSEQTADSSAVSDKTSSDMTQSTSRTSDTVLKEEATPVSSAASEGRPVESVKAVQFAQFGPSPKGAALGNLDLLLDVKMPLAVELGRTRMLIRDILELGPGSVIELDKAAGEPVDLLVNGKLIARGEVVVIDESFGLRITEILDSVPGVAR